MLEVSFGPNLIPRAFASAPFQDSFTFGAIEIEMKPTYTKVSGSSARIHCWVIAL